MLTEWPQRAAAYSTTRLFCRNRRDYANGGPDLKTQHERTQFGAIDIAENKTKHKKRLGGLVNEVKGRRRTLHGDDHVGQRHGLVMQVLHKRVNTDEHGEMDGVRSPQRGDTENPKKAQKL